MCRVKANKQTNRDVTVVVVTTQTASDSETDRRVSWVKRCVVQTRWVCWDTLCWPTMPSRLPILFTHIALKYNWNISV